MKQLLIMTAAIITSAAASAQSTSKDEQAIRTVIATMEKGWNSKNGETFASVFADNHDFVVWNGYYFPNGTRQQTAESHQRLYEGPYKTMDIRLKVDKIRMVRDDLALVHVLGASYATGSPVPENPEVLMSLLIEKKNGNWQIISFHNLDLEAYKDKQTAERSPMPLTVMYAGWFKN